MKLKQALPVLLGFIVVIALFIVGTGAIGIHEFWVSFLMILYWGSLKHYDKKEILNTIAGTAFGITMPLIGLLLGQISPIGGLVYLLLWIGMVLLYIMGKLRVIINDIAMFFLIVLSITSLTQSVDQFIGYYEALAAGAALIGILSFAFGKVAKKKEEKESSKATEAI